MKLSATIISLLIASASTAQICNGCRIQKEDVNQDSTKTEPTLNVYSRRSTVIITEMTYGAAGEKVQQSPEVKKECLKCGKG